MCVAWINPGRIDTDRLNGRVAAMRRTGSVDERSARNISLAEKGISQPWQPEEVAQLVCYLAGSPTAFMQGAIIEMTGDEGNTV